MSVLFKIVPFLLPICGLYSQIGLQLSAERNGISYLDPVGNPHVQADDYFSYQGGLHYWFKMDNIRIEFLPGVYYSYGKGKVQRDTQTEKVYFTEAGFRFQIPVLIYPLTFLDDCRCPTFSKQGNLFEDGFHLIIEPGVQYVSRELGERSSDLNFYAKLGIGLDIGVNRWNTLSPQLTYGYFFNDPFVKQVSDPAINNWPRSAHSALGFALRYLFHWNYRK